MRIVKLLFSNRPSFRRQQKLHNCKIVSVYEFIYSYTWIILDSHKLGKKICVLRVFMSDSLSENECNYRYDRQ